MYSGLRSTLELSKPLPQCLLDTIGKLSILNIMYILDVVVHGILNIHVIINDTIPVLLGYYVV